MAAAVVYVGDAYAFSSGCWGGYFGRGCLALAEHRGFTNDSVWSGGKGVNSAWSVDVGSFALLPAAAEIIEHWVPADVVGPCSATVDVSNVGLIVGLGVAVAGASGSNN